MRTRFEKTRPDSGRFFLSGNILPLDAMDKFPCTPNRIILLFEGLNISAPNDSSVKIPTGLIKCFPVGYAKACQQLVGKVHFPEVPEIACLFF